MEDTMDFEKLLTLFKETHLELQNRAARSVDISLVVRNWLFGWYLVEFEQAGADRSEIYGKKLIDRVAESLKKHGLKGVSATNLRKFREFYLVYSEIQQAVPVESFHTVFAGMICESSLPLVSVKGDVVSTAALQQIMAGLTGKFNLGWTHYVTLLTITNPEERRFYEIEAQKNSWGYRELERQITTSLYERLALSRDKDGIMMLSEKGHIVEKATDVIKNPYILEFTGLEEKPFYSEHDLESALINRLEHFLLELGKGFLFEARQKRFTFDNNHFYVDLVFYNRLLKCYVLIDLKRDELTHQDLGQMQMYVNYFDRHVKTDDELPTIGIVLCHRKHDAIVELTLPKDSNIFASKYQLYLPSKEDLKKQLEDAIESENLKKTDAE
jgi:predicted nuclease of restriction endonuclease-like (RecB) superfamily